MGKKNIKWRKENPEKLKARKREYNQRNRAEIGALCCRIPWLCHEGLLIMTAAKVGLSDRWLSHELHRTINAIQKMRHRIVTGEVIIYGGIYIRTTKAIEKAA